MVEPDERFRDIGRAIGALTAWLETDEDPVFLGEEIRRTVAEGIEAEAALTIGLVNLAGLLLIRLEKATGHPPQETLQDLARRYPAI